MLTKREVVVRLGKSKRTVETYIADGRLNCHYVNGPNGKQAAFHEEDVERLKTELDTPMVRAVHDHALVPVAQAIAPRDPFEGLAAHLAKLAALFPAPPKALPAYVTLHVALQITGLSATTIKELAGRNRVATHRYGRGLRYRRADLEAL
jgi:uncharacterized protein YodC (DUF2158 family)